MTNIVQLHSFEERLWCIVREELSARFDAAGYPKELKRRLLVRLKGVSNALATEAIVNRSYTPASTSKEDLEAMVCQFRDDLLRDVFRTVIDNLIDIELCEFQDLQRKVELTE